LTVLGDYKTDPEAEVERPTRVTLTDTTSGKLTPVTGEWEEPKDWQQPQPTVHVSGENVYVTEPEAKKLHIVDLADGTVTGSVDLPEVPGEIATASGEVPAGAEEHDHDHDHGHEDGHDHDHDHDHEDDGHNH